MFYIREKVALTLVLGLVSELEYQELSVGFVRPKAHISWSSCWRDWCAMILGLVSETYRGCSLSWSHLGILVFTNGVC